MLEEIGFGYKIILHLSNTLVLRNYFLLRQIKPGSIAEKVGLKVKDSLVKIGNDCALDYTIEEAMESLKKNKMFFDMIVER